jgi:hypothetical protein
MYRRAYGNEGALSQGLRLDILVGLSGLLVFKGDELFKDCSKLVSASLQ